MTVDADRAEQAFILEVEAFGVTDAVGELEFATQGESQSPILRLAAEYRPVGGATDREKAFTIGEFDELRLDDTGIVKTGMNVPDGT